MCGEGSSVVSQLLVDKLFAAERYMKRMEPRFLKQQEGGAFYSTALFECVNNGSHTKL